MTNENNKIFCSIVVPVYNSREMLEELVSRVSEVMNKAQLSFEMVLIDDGSCDGSFDEIKRLACSHSVVRGSRLSRNFGHQAALLVGLRQSRGSYVAIIDDDLQDPPELLPVLFGHLKEGNDVAYGVRRNRKEGFLKRLLFRGFYTILSALSKIAIPQDSGDFCAMRRCVVDAMLEMYDANPFLRGLRSWVGFRQVGVEYERSARLQGESGYTFRKYIRLALTGILMFSTLPLRLATYMGIFASLLSCSFSLLALVRWFIYRFDVPGYLSLIMLITFMGGVQLISIGVIGEYVARNLDNSRRWPVAFVAENTDEE
ncbi:MAG: glycosyltransferase family 2 protein [Proteobacteria bacterium]|nr:glycosyltransferase family 2 protein [Pseudomonadota bacterium]